MRVAPKRSSWRRTAAIITAMTVAATGSLVAAQAATATPMSTRVWAGKSLNVAEPDPGSGGQGSGIIEIVDPVSTSVEDEGDSITLPITATCYEPTSDGQVPSIEFTLGGETFVPYGEWTTDGGLETFTGAVDIDVYYNFTTLSVLAGGTSCFVGPNGSMNEPLYSFFITPFVCPELPGVSLEGETSDFPVASPSHGYTTVWELDDDGGISDNEAFFGDLGYQDDAFDGFSDWAFGDDIDSELKDHCVTRDEENGNDWGAGRYGDLALTTQNHYFASADLVRRSWTFENNTGNAVDGFDVTLETNWGSDDETEHVALTSWGQVSGDGGDSDPVVTMLWGGSDAHVADTAMLPSARIADDYAAATEDSEAWLEETGTFSSLYLEGVPGDRVLNWGDGAVGPTVFRGLDQNDDEEDIDDVFTTYAVPALADGESVTIVEFAHIQYYDAQGDQWVDSIVANGTVGEYYADAVTGPEGSSSFWLGGGSLPEGLTLNESTGAITGTPVGPAGCSVAVIGAGNETDKFVKRFVICIAAVSNSGEDSDGSEDGTEEEGEEQPADLALALILGFEVGDSLADASTLVAANGLMADSAWTLTMHSTPRVIGSGNADADGVIVKEVGLPLDTAAGAHELILAGISPEGAVVTAHAWFALDSDGIITAISLDGPVTAPAATTDASLASTGAGFVAPGLVIAVLALLLGAGLVLLRRRRAA